MVPCRLGYPACFVRNLFEAFERQVPLGLERHSAHIKEKIF